MICRSRALADMIAAAQQQPPSDSPDVDCTSETAHTVVIRREGVEVAAELCTWHAVAAEGDVGFVRSVKKRVRT